MGSSEGRVRQPRRRGYWRALNIWLDRYCYVLLRRAIREGCRCVAYKQTIEEMSPYERAYEEARAK